MYIMGVIAARYQDHESTENQKYKLGSLIVIPALRSFVGVRITKAPNRLRVSVQTENE